MMPSPEEGPARQRREFFLPFRSRHLGTDDISAADEGVETTCDEGGVEVGELW